MIYVTGTHIAYLHICHRKLWLFANGLNMEHNSELVSEGKLIHESSYLQRASKWKEVVVEGIKIDHYDSVLKIVREIKKSNKKESSHIAQLKYYLFVLERNGISAKKGILEYPKLRITEEVILTDDDRLQIPKWEEQVMGIISALECPPLLKMKICKKCAYYEFCFS